MPRQTHFYQAHCYVLEHDPLHDYQRGAMFSTREIPATLAVRGFNLGTILRRGAGRYIVIEVIKGCYELRPLARKEFIHVNH